MIEFVVVWMLARGNGRIARTKNLSAELYWVITAALWFGLEIAGFLVGRLLMGPRAPLLGLYLFGLVGAIIGAILSRVIANQADPGTFAPSAERSTWRPTHTAPLGGLPGWPVPDSTQPSTAIVPGGAEVVLSEARGDWARIRCENGWAGWVDARALILIQR
jgi:hypothetical protein